MSFLEEKPSPNHNPRLKKTWSDLWLKNPSKPLIFAMQYLHSPSLKPNNDAFSRNIKNGVLCLDLTLLLSDDLLLQILAKLPLSQRLSVSLVCKRWLALLGRLRRSLKLLHWNFLHSTRLFSRFPNLTHLDLVPGSVISSQNPCILLTHRFISMAMNSAFSPNLPIWDENSLGSEVTMRRNSEFSQNCRICKENLMGSENKLDSGFSPNCHICEENSLSRANSRKMSSGFSPNWRIFENSLSRENSRKMSSGFSQNWRICKEKLLGSENSRKMSSGFSPNWRICKEKLFSSENSAKMNSGFSQNWHTYKENLFSSEISTNIKSVHFPNWRICEEFLLSSEVVDEGLKTLATTCPNLRKLAVINASELGLLSVAEECFALQELELHKCNDNVLRGIAACENLQVLKLVGSVEGLYNSVVSDLGLTILAQGCKRMVKLELVGCEGSFDGIKAIGQCCRMLEELVICNHRMDSGWLAALSYYENLKSLKFLSCKQIDSCPGPDEYLGSCPALERLHLQKCQLREKKNIRAMFMVCGSVRDIVIQDCWGLDNDTFSLASAFRSVKFLSLEGCSLLTTGGLESVILSWKELESLVVVSCKHIKDSEISPALSTLFSVLKDLKWRPDTKSLLSSTLVETGMGKRGGKFFKKS